MYSSMEVQMLNPVPRWIPLTLLLALLPACGPEDELDGLPPPGEDLPLGDVPDIKADGTWGHATTCKTFPTLTGLAEPRITISLNGLTLRLEDKKTGFSKVYPVGVGEINKKSSSITANESLSMYPVLRYERNDFSIDTASVNPCRIWWRNPATGKRLPVFAGLPFISWYGPYGIHGPVSSYYLASGGKLKRGFVSHGCIRMEGDDVAELWAYIRDTPTVPVRVQKEIDRGTDGAAFDLKQRWILSECSVDAECNFSGGYCKKNAYSGRGFCTAACDRYCNYDKYGYPVTFCVNDPDDSKEGYCTYKASAFNYSCRRFDGFAEAPGEPRFSQPTVKADVCKPGSSGWIGARCLSSDDCMSGRFCSRATTGAKVGFCTETCTKYCPDLSGHPTTFCVAGLCRTKCDADRTGEECSAGHACTLQKRHNQPWVTSGACMPK